MEVSILVAPNLPREMVTAGSIASRRGIPTADKTHEVALSVVGNSAPERCFFLNKVKYTSLKKSLTTIPVKLKPGKSQTFELVAPANGKADKNAIIANGSFDDNYAAEKSLIQTRMSRLTMPVALPDAVEITIEGDKNDGRYIIDIPYCVDNIADVKVEGGKLISLDSKSGKAVVSGGATKIRVGLIK